MLVKLVEEEHERKPLRSVPEEFNLELGTTCWIRSQQDETQKVQAVQNVSTVGRRVQVEQFHKDFSPLKLLPSAARCESIAILTLAAWGLEANLASHTFWAYEERRVSKVVIMKPWCLRSQVKKQQK